MRTLVYSAKPPERRAILLAKTLYDFVDTTIHPDFMQIVHALYEHKHTKENPYLLFLRDGVDIEDFQQQCEQHDIFVITSI